MSKPDCENCNDTGRSIKGGSKDLDCAQCDAAIERTALESEFPIASKEEFSDTIWAVHQRARRIERASFAESHPLFDLLKRAIGFIALHDSKEAADIGRAVRAIIKADTAIQVGKEGSNG